MINDKAAFDIRTMRIGTGITYGKPASIPGKTSTYEKHRIRKKTVLHRTFARLMETRDLILGLLMYCHSGFTDSMYYFFEG